ncbi:hypothetical protein SAICODRAFT_10274 [Saitoella complicata NRRL Y-17804]|nr:uncharacterized protein SAICODRAFT_10274 [Saitoella complicata NRRL Y-17804]ODQ49979.1 hypothetical protein SAICODRAFT_10274 [Saitoella complicata NRRL Y-17804]
MSLKLPVSEEDVIIKSRLAVEERPLKRIVKQVGKITSLTELPTGEELDALREELDLEFSSFSNTIFRQQVLRTANEREVARYEAEKLSIQQSVTQTQTQITQSRFALSHALQSRAQKISYDNLARTILSRHPKSRSEINEAISELEREISELEQEREGYAETWQRRKEQFTNVEAGLEGMRRVIQGEPEGSAEEEGDRESDEVDMVDTPRGATSGTGTPSGTHAPSPSRDRERERERERTVEKSKEGTPNSGSGDTAEPGQTEEGQGGGDEMDMS